MASRHRNFTFTHNNYADTELEDGISCRYIAYSKEVAPATGTPHLQGYISFENGKTKKAVIGLMPGCHIEIMMGTFEQNEAYCSKAGILFERGVKPMTNDNKGRCEKLRWATILKQAKEGKIDDIDADVQIRYYSTFKAIAMDNMTRPEPLQGTCGLWIYGESGSGKSRSVFKSYPDHYIKARNKSWNGYQGQDVVVLDEVCPEDTKWIAQYLKDWADWKPFHADIKYGAKQLRPKKFIVTSNYTIDEMGFAEGDLPAIKRRYREVTKTRDQDIMM